jgi:hypothetical protein
MTNNSVREKDPSNSVESNRLSRYQCFRQKVQIQRHSLHHRSIITIGRTAPESSQGPDRKLIAHPDNEHPHRAGISLTLLKKNDMTTAPHPPYSPDFAPSDFFLFVHVKQLLL